MQGYVKVRTNRTLMPQIGRRLPQIWKSNQRISASISVICVLSSHFDVALVQMQ